MALWNVSRHPLGHSGGAVPESHRSSLFVGSSATSQEANRTDHQHTNHSLEPQLTAAGCGCQTVFYCEISSPFSVTQNIAPWSSVAIANGSSVLGIISTEPPASVTLRTTASRSSTANITAQ